MSKRDPLPPKSVPVIIRQFNGQILLGVVTYIDSLKLRVSRPWLVEVVGLRTPRLEPIYGIRSKIAGPLDIPLDTIVHWETAPANLGGDID